MPAYTAIELVPVKSLDELPHVVGKTNKKTMEKKVGFRDIVIKWIWLGKDHRAISIISNNHT